MVDIGRAMGDTQQWTVQELMDTLDNHGQEVRDEIRRLVMVKALRRVARGTYAWTTLDERMAMVERGE